MQRSAAADVRLRLAPQGVYWTIQGEGFLAGEPMVFVRLSGCSVGCPQCDTNYKHHADSSVEQIVDECCRLRSEYSRAKFVWVTGGEPTEQHIAPLADGLNAAGFLPCLLQ